MTATHRVFVYGTLKQGFANFQVNRGVRLAGEFETVAPMSIWVIGDYGLPWLVHDVAGGAVRGQLFEVDEATLADLDRFEEIDRPDQYERRALIVRRTDGGAVIEAQAYLGSVTRLARERVLAGPLVEYRLEHQRFYRDG